jgi:hypothetical protein
VSAVSRLDGDEKDVCFTDTLGGSQATRGMPSKPWTPSAARRNGRSSLRAVCANPRIAAHGARIRRESLHIVETKVYKFWTLYLIAPDSVPEAARTEVIERAEAGEKLTHAQVKEIVDKAVAEVTKGIKSPRCEISSHPTT